jgi:hypothetical protein
VSDPARRVVTRNLVVQCWGMPDATIGSVNEPREGEENGVSFNEKWTYRHVGGDPRSPRQRMVYWRRYDFVASFLVEADGALVREDAAVLCGGLNDRLYRPSATPTRG